MAINLNQQMKLVTVCLMLSMHMTTSKSANFNPSPVHEIAEEQPRSISNPGTLPFINPLAGNSAKNARLHAQNQQAMYNAERIRQHKAQLQRWTKAPLQVDSYMKAYRESQENHQLAAEQEQAKLRESRGITTLRPYVTTKSLDTKQENIRDAKKTPVILKITKEDAMIRTQKKRNHRSHGSEEYQMFIQPRKYQSVHLAPGPTFDEGVTIKPNGVAGLTSYQTSPDESRLLYTDALSSNTGQFYPSQFNTIQNYQPTKNIDTLNTLLVKSPNDQLSGLNALIESNNDEQLNTPVDLYFYVKNEQRQPLTSYREQTPQTPHNYPNAYISKFVPTAEDYKPITENIDDIEDPNKSKTIKFPIARPMPVTASLELETTTVKTNNYYKVEVASQTITSSYKPTKPKQIGISDSVAVTNPETTQSDSSPYYLVKNAKPEGDSSKRYLHHNAQDHGVQYLTRDGTGVSAYGDESLQYAASYEFAYRVQDDHSGNDFGHHEEMEDGKTNGQYHVLLPDGRLQNVKYSAGPSGFHADITYNHLQNP